MPTQLHDAVKFMSSSLATGRKRDIGAVILARADALPREDRDLVAAVYRDGKTVLSIVRAQDATAATLAHRAAAVRRRLRRLTLRLLDPAFEVVRVRSGTWPPMMARIARMRFIDGVSIKETAVRLRVTPYTVRTISVAIRAMALTPAPEKGAAA